MIVVFFCDTTLALTSTAVASKSFPTYVGALYDEKYLALCFVLFCRVLLSGCVLFTHMHAEHNNTINTSDTVLTKIYLTLFERVVYERELETEQNCNILTLLLWP